MIEGGGSKTMSKSRAWLKDHSDESRKLLNLLTDVCVDYLIMQIKSGAQILQIFESSAEYMTKDEFIEFALPYLKDIRVKLHAKIEKEGIEKVPLVVFAKGAMHSLAEMVELGYDVIGLDWSIDPVEARKIVGPNVTLQGNLDPQDLYKTPEEVRALTKTMVQKFGKDRYIANLGHGITPQTPIISMTTFVDAVHSAFDD